MLPTSLSPTTPKQPSRLSDLLNDNNLHHKILTLIYDLKHMSSDKACENRTLRTTDPLYTSEPCFSPEEAMLVKSAIADDEGTTLEKRISERLENLFEKRRASGDWRPCGPHDMAPVYMSVFGIDSAELEDEKFVSRVRRSGLGTA